MSSNINFNLNPYYDDFDETKNFQRILFRPGYAVQARELTQIQSQLQNQIEKFGKHIFKDGGIVLGGQFNIDTKVDYVKITEATDVTNTTLSDLIGTILVGVSSGVKAYVVDIGYKSDWGYDSDVLMVRYTTSGASSSLFTVSEQLRVETDLAPITYTVASISPTGKGSLFSIDEGVAFSRGFFVNFEKQNIVLDPISSTPTCKIGFSSLESIISPNQDPSLLDPALGSYNYSAPGGDRLQVYLTLTKVDIAEETSLPDFSVLFSIVNGDVVELKERTAYSRIYDEFAKRTYDESGDYVVNGFGVRIREHLDTGSNEGYLSLPSGNVNSLAIGIEPGVAYIKGYEVNNRVTKYIETDKSSDYLRVNSEIISAKNGNYILVNQVMGSPLLDVGQVVGLYNLAEARVRNRIASTTVPSGTKIGEAKVKAFEYDSDGQYKLYLFDIKMIGTNIFSNVNSVYQSGFFADTAATSNTAVLSDSISNGLLYPVGASAIRKIRTTDDSTSDTTFSFKRTDQVTISAAGTFTATVSPTNETHSYGSGGSLLSSLDKTGITLSLNAASSNTIPGLAVGTISGSTLVGTSTFFTRLNVGDRIAVSNIANTYTVASIANNTNLTITETFSASFTNGSLTKKYLLGDIIKLTNKGVDSGTDKTITATTNKVLSFDLKETFPSTLSANVSYNITRSSAKEVKKTLIPSIYVQINCAALSSLTAPINLGVSDVYQIKQIRKHTAAFTTNAQGSLVTTSFDIDNGQRDDMYDLATITAKSSLGLSLTDKLLIELDYFKPDFSAGFGFFSIDSYPINDTTVSSSTIFTHQIPVYKSSYNGAIYNLRNYIDFRPVKLNTATDSYTVSGATVNPSTTDTFNKDISGLRIPYPSSQILCDYSYYISRRDVVVSDYLGNFEIIRGVPSIYPVTPPVSENVMGIANLYIPPYPSLSSTYARSLAKESEGVTVNKITYKRHTMRDIGVLKQRIENLEYYNALSLLEKSAIDLLILDTNGLDRFKNGFFVDGFLDHSLGATYNIDYKICVDKEEGVIRPFFEMESFGYDYNLLNSTNVTKTGNLITLPYTESILLEQSKATTFRNIEQSVFRFIGKITMTPDIDVWVDDATIDRVIEFGNDIPAGTVLSTEWNSWQKYITGTTKYNVYSRNYGDRSNDLRSATLIGSFDSYASAQQVANNIVRGYIETVDNQGEISTRTGIQTTVSSDKIQQEIGSFVTDVSIVPYIRPQTIEVYVQGLKANTTYYTYFDGEDMSSYLAPAIIDDSATLTPSPLYYAEGHEWKTNSYGMLYGKLRIPASGKRFRIGEKEIIITDSLTNASDATSYAKSYFVASGLNAQKQNTILSTKQIRKTKTSESKESSLASKQTVDIFGPSCMAYSFFVKAPSEEVGIFLTSVDVFIKNIHPTLGVWFEIRAMDNSGGITGDQVPYSEKWYKSSEITTTNDATTAHNVLFPSPVFLLNNTQYALVIHTEGLNPDTYFWVSRLGETDIITKNAVTGRQLTGSLYTTNNNLNWSIVPDLDLKVRFNRAVFNTGVIGNAYFGNKHYEFLTITPPTTTYTNYGESIIGSDIVSLSGITGGTISVGDKLKQGSVTANVVSINSTLYYTNGSRFNTSNTIYVLDSSGVAKTPNVSATATAVNYGTAKLLKFDGNNSIRLSDSNGKFFANGTITGLSSNISTTIQSFSEYNYSVINLKPRHLHLAKTTCDFQVSGLLSSSNTQSAFEYCTPDTTFVFDAQYSLKSYYDEINTFSNNSSTKVKTIMASTSEYVSPVVDVGGANVIFIRNIINSNTTNENKASGGNLLNRYISKTVTLADGQDAEDLQAMITAYIPSGASVKVWMKIKHAEDGQLFSAVPWVEMTPDKTGVYSSLANKNNFLSFTYTIPTEMMTGANQAVQYTSPNGNVFTGFKQFAIKIGLIGDDSAIVPRVGDLKVIALQK